MAFRRTATSPPHPDDSRMSLAAHLRELRRRLIIAAAAVVVGTIAAFAVHGHILHVLTHPYCSLPASYRLVHDRCTLVVSGVLDPFTVTLRLSLYAGVLLSSPVWLWLLWRFVAPGVYENEGGGVLGLDSLE